MSHRLRGVFRNIVIVGYMAALVGLTTVMVGGEVTTWTRLECALALLFLVFHTRPIFLREFEREAQRTQPEPSPPRMEWLRPEPVREPIRREVWRVVDPRTGRAAYAAAILPALTVETTIADLPDTPERRTDNVRSAR
jgi:hypothetical protein